MIPKKIYKLTNKSVREDIIYTLNEIKDVVTATMGPFGSTVVLYNGDTIPHVTKDGVSVAEFIQFDNNFRETINRLVKESARMTGEKVGDGTTTSILLTTSLVIELLEDYDNYRTNITIIEEDLEKAISLLEKMTIKLDVFNDEGVIDKLAGVIRISSNDDDEIVNTIIPILQDIGADGLIDVIEANGENTYVEVTDGMLIEAPAMIGTTVDLDTPYIVLVDDKITKSYQIKNLLEFSYEKYKIDKSPVILIADEFSDEVKRVVEINFHRGKVGLYLVESDGFGLTKKEIYEDMALVLGTEVLSLDASQDNSLQNIPRTYSALAKKATITPNHTIITPIDTDSTLLDSKKKEIKDKITEIKNSGEARVGELAQLHKRLNKYAKSATIHVGGSTAAERLEKKDRMDDAVLALGSAVNYGVLPGGGLALYKVFQELFTGTLAQIVKLPTELFEEETGINLSEYYVAGTSVNFLTGEIGDFIKVGVIDPAQITIKALKQSVAIAKSIVGSKAIIVPEKESYGEV